MLMELHGRAFPSPEKVHSNVQVLFQNHSKLGFLQGEEDMTPGSAFLYGSPLCFAGSTTPYTHTIFFSNS